MATLYTQVRSNKIKSLLYIAAFMALVLGIGWFAQYYLDAAWIFPVALVIAIVMSFSSYWYSDKLALATSGAKVISKKENPYIYRMVENLAITAGLPVPKVAVIDDSAINAFATGRDPKHAAIAVTQGAIDRLENEELEGVLAHELSHVGNYDTRLMTIVTVLAGLITLMADFLLRWSWMGGDRGRETGQLGLIIFVVGLVLVLLSPFIAMLIQLAVSRKREFAADATGALMTRYPEGLAKALEKIDKDQEPLEVANKATAHLYISNPFKNGSRKAVGWFAGLFSTHPAVEERVKALRQMSV